MNKEPEPEKTPVSQPAPQLPNLPLSPDDPFQPDIEWQALTTLPLDPPTAPHQPASRPAQKREPAADDESR